MGPTSYFGGAHECAALLRDCGLGAVLIAAAWIVFRLVPRVPAAARCMVWWLLCLKMLVGLVWFAAPVTFAVLPAKSFPVTSPPAPMPGSHPPSFGKEGLGNVGFREGTEPTPPSLPLRKGRDQQPPLELGAGMGIWPLIRNFWLWGMGAFFALLAGQFLRAATLRRDAHLAPPGRCWEMMAFAAKALGLASRPHVLVSLTTPIPMTAGLLKPVILLPGKDAFTLTDDELRMVLAHEAAHIRRRDLWLGLVPALAQAVFFFHPLVWLAHREYLLAREEACDALALRATDLPADQYGRLLLRFSTLRGGAGAAVAISGSQAVRNLRRRLAMLQGIRPLSMRQRWAWSIGLSVLGILCITPVALTERAAQSSRQMASAPRRTARSVGVPESALQAKTASAETAAVSRIMIPFQPRQMATHPAGRLAMRLPLPRVAAQEPTHLTLQMFPHERLTQAVQVADARLSAMPEDQSKHFAQTPVEIRELPAGIGASSSQNDSVPAVPPVPPVPAVPDVPAVPAVPAAPAVPRVPPAPPIPRTRVRIPPMPPIHVHVPAIHVHVPEVRVDIPEINVNVPAMSGFTFSTNDDGHVQYNIETARDRRKALDEAKRDRAEALQDAQQALREAARDRAEALDEAEQDREEAKQEAAQDRAEALNEAKDDREEAQQEVTQSRREADQERREIAQAQREAEQAQRDSAQDRVQDHATRAEALDTAHQALTQAEQELREELRHNPDGIARQALEQALQCVQKSRTSVSKP